MKKVVQLKLFDIFRQRRYRPYLLVHDEAMEDFEEFRGLPNPNAVLVGLAPEKFVYSKLNEVRDFIRKIFVSTLWGLMNDGRYCFQAFQVILNGGRLVAIHKGRYYRDDKGLSLGPGPFVAALEYASEAAAEVVGKPNDAFFVRAMAGLATDPTEVVMIGDVCDISTLTLRFSIPNLMSL